jgi:hypothetical protein
MNKIEKVKQRSAAAASHLVHTGFPGDFEFQKAAGLNLKKHQNHVEHRHAKFQVVNPASQPVNALATGSSFHTDFRIPNSEPLQQMWIQVSLLCDATFSGTAAALTDSNVWACVDRIQILAENGSVILQEMSGYAMEAYHYTLDETKYRAISNALRGANANQQGLTLDAGESGDIYIPILFNPLTDNEIPVSALSSPITVRVYWKSGQYIYDTQEQDITSVSLLVQQYQYDSSLRSKIFSKLNSSTPAHFRFARQGKQELSASITPGSPYDLRLSGIHGIVTEMTLEVLISDTTVELDSIDLLDSSGQTLLGSRMKTRFLLAAKEVNHSQYVQSGKPRMYVRVPISSSNTEEHAQAGQLNAYHVFNGNDTLSFTYVASDGSTTPVTAAIRVMYSGVSTMEVKNGTVSIAHS